MKTADTSIRELSVVLFLRRPAAALASLLVLLGLLALPVADAEATPVADSDQSFAAFGRAFPDPHGCLDGALPTVSPHARGDVCAVQFIQWDEALAGLRYLEQAFPGYVELINLAEVGIDGHPELEPADFRSAGIAREDLSREQRDLYVVKVTDKGSDIHEADREHFVYSLSIHGIERAGLEGGLRAVEDLATWAACENDDAPASVDCAGELDGKDARRLLDPFDDGGRSPTAGEALRDGVLLFTLSNPDGWVRGDYSEGGAFYQRFNGNGMDLNRDWPTVGYTDATYESWSEPETRGFGTWLKHVADESTRDGSFAGGIDLHGMVTANSLSYTLLGAGQKDYRKNAVSVDTASLMWADAEERLTWSPHVARQEDCPGPVPEPFFGQGRTQGPMCTVQWGTVWDTIEYQITGGMGDWIDHPDIGLGGVGINNEMALSHLAPNNIFDPGIVQLQIEGNKSLIYSQVTALLGDDSATYEPGGRIGYLADGDRVEGDTELVTEPDTAGLSPQESLGGMEITGAQGFTFEVRGHKEEDPEDRVYNRGMTVEATFTNVRGIGAGSVASLILDYCGPAEGQEMALTHQHAHEHDVRAALSSATGVSEGHAAHPHQRQLRHQPELSGDHSRWGHGVFADYGFGAGDRAASDSCEEVARHHSGGPIYVDSGAQIALNRPKPGVYRIRPNPERIGASRYEVTFTDGEAIPGWEEQVAYSVSRTDFFEDLNGFVDGGDELAPLAVDDIAATPELLQSLDTFVITDRFTSQPRDEGGAEPAPDPAFVDALRGFVAAGGNLVLTDGAMAGLGELVPELGGQVERGVFYAGYIDFNDGEAPTFDTHPLTADLERDGTASGRQTLNGEEYHDRRQTYEPVPTGFLVGAPASCNSGCDAPVWVVDEDAWRDAGGLHLGRSFVRGGPDDSRGWDGVSLGELAVGDGVIRIVGALLPEPTQDNFHPYGLSSHGLTYTGYQLFENATTWDNPARVDGDEGSGTDPEQPDSGDVSLRCSDDCEIEVRAGETGRATLEVHNEGEEPTTVRLAVDLPQRWEGAVAPDATELGPGERVEVELSVTPARNARGTHLLEVRAEDEAGAVAVETVTVEVRRGRPSDPGSGGQGGQQGPPDHARPGERPGGGERVALAGATSGPSGTAVVGLALLALLAVARGPLRRVLRR